MLKRRRRQPSQAATATEVCEERMMLSSTNEVASIDGTGNNLTNEEWGSSHEELLRLTTSEYADGYDTLAEYDRPSAREVSNAISAVTELEQNSRYLTDVLWVWGQFIDHDLDLSEGGNGEYTPIEVPTGDPWFDPFGTGEAVIPFTRTGYEHDADGVRQQFNEITAFLDGSAVYGSDQERADALRSFEGGLLKTSDGDLLPWNAEGLANAGGTSDTLFLAGDIRANENIALSAMHTVWVREHNRIATELAAENPDLTDEELYQEARAIVRAEMQAITYNEFLPALLGANAVSQYDGYDDTVNPDIANIFSTAAYRFGHSLLSPELQRLDADGTEAEEGHIALQSAFFRPDELVTNGIDSILRGATVNVAQELDNEVVDDVRNFLFGPPGSGGFDLASLNIQRGRDHGLPDYNQARIDMGLEPAASFSDITSDADLAGRLEAVYGDINNVDVWVGGLSEDALPGSSMGELFQSIIVDQFERIRDGDRFWYQNIMSGRELREIENTTLADVIERNTDIEGLQDNIFFAPTVLHVDVDSSRVRDVTVRERNGQFQVIDDRARRVIASQAIQDTDRIMLVGDMQRDERFTVNPLNAENLPGGVVAEFGGGRRDTLQITGSSRSDTITVGDQLVDMNGLEIQHSGTNEVLVRAGRGNDTVEVADGTDVRVRIFGGRGADRLFGGQGNDFIDGEGGNDRIDGGGGRDRLFGRAGNDRINGGPGADMLDGGDGNDRINGGAGNDRMIGGEGRDIVNGGRGRNQFAVAPGQQDRIDGRANDDVRRVLNMPRHMIDAVFTRQELDALFG